MSLNQSAGVSVTFTKPAGKYQVWYKLHVFENAYNFQMLPVNVEELLTRTPYKAGRYIHTGVVY